MPDRTGEHTLTCLSWNSILISVLRVVGCVKGTEGQSRPGSSQPEGERQLHHTVWPDGTAGGIGHRLRTQRKQGNEHHFLICIAHCFCLTKKSECVSIRSLQCSANHTAQLRIIERTNDRIDKLEENFAPKPTVLSAPPRTCLPLGRSKACPPASKSDSTAFTV